MSTGDVQRLADLPLGIALWRIDLDAQDSAAAEGWLSDAERRRAARFAFDADRRRYVAAHGALRRLLAEQAGVPAGLPFDIGPHGKPSLPGAAVPLRFNLSHSGRWALVGLHADSEIGVDLEPTARAGRWSDLAAAHFTDREQRAVADDPSTFLAIWTRKEACLKAHGAGLAGPPPAQVHVGSGPARETVSLRTGNAEDCIIDVLSCDMAPDLVVAVARQRTAESLTPT